MKNTRKQSLKKLVTLLVCIAFAFALCSTAYAEEVTFEDKLGEAVSLTEGISLKDGVFTNEGEVLLDFKSASDVNDSLGASAWRAIVRLAVSEKVTDGELANAKYYIADGNGWKEVGLISESDIYNSTDRTVAVVLPVSLSDLEKDSLSVAYAFDWDCNGAEETVQEVKISLDMSKVKLVHTAGCTEADGEIQIDPTCTEIGYTKTVICSVCGLTIMDKEEIPALGHEFTEKIVNDDHFKTKTDGISAYYYNCSREGCDVISDKLVYTLNESDYSIKNADVSPLTDGLTVDKDGTNNVSVVNGGKITLDWSPKDLSIGRYMDAWWVGAKITANGELTADELKEVKYRSFGKNGWSQAKSFWANKDSADDAAEHFITVWVPVTPEYIANAKDGLLTFIYEFDWDNNGLGISTQVITISIDVTKVNLIHSAGHTEAVDTEAVEATCFESGYTKQSHCSVCGLVLSVREEIKALGHDFSKKVISPECLAEKANCVHYDQYFYKCSRCDALSGRDKVFEDDIGSVLVPHEKLEKLDKIHLASPADCENPAVYYMGCRNCDTVFEETFETGTPLYHSWRIEKVTKKATTKEAGTINFFCDDCGKMDNYPIPIAKIASVKLSATKFDYTGKDIKPTVTVKDSNGNTLKKDRDYTVKYSGYDLPGTATAKVTFKGQYEGTVSLSYKIIIPATSKIAYTATSKSIKLSWRKVSSADGYYVYIRAGSSWKRLKKTTATSYTASGLKAGTQYTFAVKSYINKNGTTYPSSVYAKAYTTTVTAPPKTVTVKQSTTAIRLSWSAVKNTEGYSIYVKSSTGSWKHLKTVTTTSFTYSKLKAGTDYTFAIKTVNKTYSGAKLASSGYTTVKTATRPVAPTVSVTSSNGRPQIRWSGVKGATAYEIYYRSASSRTLILLDTVDAGTTVYDDYGYTVGSKYVFAVRAKKAVQGGYIYSSYGKTTVTMK